MFSSHPASIFPILHFDLNLRHISILFGLVLQAHLTVSVQSPSLRTRLIVSSLVMQSLAQEIQSFSRARLRKQCTRVTTLSGRRIIETWKGSTITVVEDPTHTEKMLGYILDTSSELRVGTVLPYLLLGET